MYIYLCIYVIQIYIYISYTWSRVPCSYPPQWYGSPGSTPFPFYLEAIGAFLRSTLASYLLGLCSICGSQPCIYQARATFQATYVARILPQSTYALPIVAYTCAMYLLPIQYHACITLVYIPPIPYLQHIPYPTYKPYIPHNSNMKNRTERQTKRQTEVRERQSWKTFNRRYPLVI